MFSVLDHKMKRSEGGRYEYGTILNKKADGIIMAFNGEKADGIYIKDDPICIKGEILLRPTPRSSKDAALTRVPGGCPLNFASYDDHPGYDYYAELGVPVYAAAEGKVLTHSGARCFVGHMGKTCDHYGAIGIDHGNGYVTQYLHMSGIRLKPGESVRRGDQVGFVDKVGTGSVHLHFEVLRRLGSDYVIVDPYGWVGSGSDPLYSASAVKPAQLWRRD